MKLSIKKIAIIFLAALLIFLLFTYVDQWRGAVAKNKTKGYANKISQLSGKTYEAKQKCPTMIKNLQAEIKQLKKKNNLSKITLNQKLIADCALTAQNYETAKQYYQKLITKEANTALLYRLYARALNGQGNLASALRYSHLAVQLEPGSFKNRVLEARVLAQLNETVKAIDAYQEALKLVPYRKVTKVRNELNQLIDEYNLNQITTKIK